LDPDPPLWELIGILLCLGLSAFFSSAETALTGLSESKAKQISESDTPGARFLDLWINFPNRILTTILIGNNLVNIIAASLFTKLALSHFEEWGASIAVFLTTVLVLIFGEIIPKTFARYNREWMAVPYIIILKFFYFIFYPVTRIMVPFSRWTIRAIGGNSKEAPTVTEDELEYMVKLSKEEGSLEKEKTEMLESIFTLDDITAKEIMIPRTLMIAARMDSSIQELLKTFSEGRHSRLPVYNESLDKIEGIIYARDILGHIDKKGLKSFKIQDYLRKPLYIPYSQKIDDLLKHFQEQKIHMAIVVDEFGGTDGLVTMEDILEEIVGEIYDEMDEDPPIFEKLDEFSFRVDAMIPIRDLEEEIEDLKFPEDGDYETLGGFLFEAHGDVPEIKETYDFQNYIFEILEADEKKIIKVKISKSKESSKENPDIEPDPNLNQKAV